MRLLVVLAAAWPGAAMAQTEAVQPPRATAGGEVAEPAPAAVQAPMPEPELDEDMIYACGSRIRPRLPSEEAMELGRKLALELDQSAISRRVEALLATVEEEDEAPGEPSRPDRPVRAVGSVQPSRNPDWSFALHARAVDHAALVYARRYPVGELEQMVRFFQSSAGRSFLADRSDLPVEVADALGSPHLEEDLHDVVCRPRGPAGPVDGPNHGYVRFHPPIEGIGRERPPAWCIAPLPAQPPAR